MKIITPKTLREKYPCYEDMADLAEIFQHRIVINDEAGPRNIRWEENKLIGYLTDYDRKIVSLNDLAIARSRGIFTLEEYMKFYMGIGYSLSGYAEVFGQCEITEYNLEYIEQPPEDHNFDEEYWETPIEYIRKKYKNKKANV